MLNYINRIHKTVNSKIRYVCGDIYYTECGLYDGVISFLPASHEYERIINERCKDVVVLLYNFNYQPKLYKSQIPSAVFKSFETLKTFGCRRIAFHGIHTIDASDKESERIVINSIVSWGKKNDNSIDMIYLVDMADSYYYDFPETVLD